MSTKLHHGYRLTAGTDPFTFISQARQVLDPVRDQADARMLMAWASELVDRVAVRGPAAPADLLEEAREPLVSTLMGHLDKQRRTPEHERGHDPNRVELSFGRDELSGRVGVLLFADNDLLVKAFAGMTQVEAYGYWNNTDKPEEVSDLEWEERREFWDRVLPGFHPPAEVMLSWKLRGRYNPGDLRLIAERYPLLLQEMPSRATRARQAAQVEVVAAAIDGVSDMMEKIRRAGPAMDVSAYPQVVDAVEALLPVVDMDVLENGYVPAQDAATVRARARVQDLARQAAAAFTD